MNLKRESAARFSFLLATPIVLGAGLKKLYDALQLPADAITSAQWPAYTLGFLAAAISGYGTTIGFHRLLTHLAFGTHQLLRYVGHLRLDGRARPGHPLVPTHRRHHQETDHEGDPHSPHLHGGGLAADAAALASHIGWCFEAARTWHSTSKICWKTGA